MKDEIEYLISLAIDFIAGLGMAKGTLKNYKGTFSFVSGFYEARNATVYDQSIMDEISAESETLYEEEKIAYDTKRLRQRAVMFLEELHETGEAHWSVRHDRKEPDISDYFRERIEDYLLSLNSCSDRKKEIYHLLAVFCAFLGEHQVSVFTDLRQKTMREYLAFIQPTRPNSMDEVIRRVRMFLNHVRESGEEVDQKVFLLLARPAKPNRTVKPAISQADIVKILNSVDRSKAPGKRDYAILVLAVYTGLRSVDIANLKISDIYWKEKELRLTQQKTGQPLCLPLDDTVVNALADYILNERPETDCDIVFLKFLAPFAPFSKATGIRAVLTAYMKKAGIDRAPGDGKTFHGLRRTLATDMLSEGTPVTTVSQVLGHSNVGSTKQYISVDMTGLRKCALSFDSIGGEEK